MANRPANQLIDELEDIADSLERLQDLSYDETNAAKPQTAMHYFAYSTNRAAKVLARPLGNLIEALIEKELSKEEEEANG